MMGNEVVEMDPEQLKALRSMRSTPPARTAPPARPQPSPAERTPTEPVRAAPTVADSKEDRLRAIAERMDAEDVCDLAKTATQIVPGQGNLDPDLVFIGEAPGREEDQQGLAFVGESGGILTRLIQRADMTREDVWIGNIVKWRPPNNRTPTLQEIDACMPYLIEQLEVLDPKVIVCLGGTAVKGLLKTSQGIMSLRGQWQSFRDIPVMPTYHPSFLLRSHGKKRKKVFDEVWSDMVQVLEKLGRTVPA